MVALRQAVSTSHVRPLGCALSCWGRLLSVLAELWQEQDWQGRSALILLCVG